MSAPKPTAPKCIAEALGLNESDHPNWRTRINEDAQAVWEALLAEGEVREQGTYAYTWKRSLVVPLERDAQDA